MMKWMQLPLALAMVATLACDRGDRPVNDTATGTGGTVGTTGTDDGLGMERGFVEDQLEDGEAEVRLGRLAQDRASNPEVRAFAEMMVRDHTKAGDELKQIASRHNLRMDEKTGDHGDHNDLQERLAKLSGVEFDREYIDAMVDDHEKAINDVEDKTDSNNQDVKQWATSTLPTLKQHLERAKSIQENLRNANTGRDNSKKY